MSALTIYSEAAERLAHYEDFEAIRSQLAELGVEFARWNAGRALSPDAGQVEVLDVYKDEVARLNERYGFQSVDVVALRPDNPKKDELRQLFLDEHTHADFEVRFFVDGAGLFYLHVGDRVYAVFCEGGDLISVPAGTTHWFDMGSAPSFKCIRLFTTPEGWKGEFTGSGISKQLPDFDRYLAEMRE